MTAAPSADGLVVPWLADATFAPAARRAAGWLAIWLSRLASPPLVATAMLANVAGGGRRVDMAWLVLFEVPAVVVPALGVAALVLAGRVVDFDLSDRRQRHLPFGLAAASAGLATAALAQLGAPGTIVLFGTAWSTLLVALCIVTLRWKISLHAAALGAAVALDLALGGRHAVGWTIAALAVGWSRIVLRRHTTRQVLAGAAVGAAAVLWAGL